VVVTSLGKGTLSPNYNLEDLKLGTNYTVTATPAAGFVFSNWLNGAGQVVGTAPKLTFTMSPGLELFANFIPNPFPPSAGNYAGLFGNTNAITPATAGAFSARLTSQGSLSASLFLAGSTYKLPGGAVLVSGVYSNATTGPNKETLSVQLQLDLAHGLGLTGTVNLAGSPVPLLAYRAVYGSTNHAPQGGKNYTLVLAPGTTNAASGPAGYGFGSVSLDALGNVTFSGVLGDGAAASQGIVLAGPGTWPFYVSPSAAKGQELAWGWIDLGTNAAREGYLVTGQVIWVKNSRAPGLYSSAGFDYPNGVEVLGSLYVPESGARAVWWTNGVLNLVGGNLASGLTNPVTSGAGGKLSATNNSLSLTIRSSGLFQGSITPAKSRPINLNGAILQMHQPLMTPVQDSGYGVFTGTNQSGSVFVGAGQLGNVFVHPPDPAQRGK
jgi:hypothetical protein